MSTQNNDSAQNTNDIESPSTPSPGENHANNPSDANTDTPGQAPEKDRLIPVTEAIRYRKRAQAAEQQIGLLQSQLSETQTALSQTRQTIAQLERRQKIDALLADADAVDFEVARLLTEAAVEVMDQPDVALAIADLKRGKPYLFRQRSGGMTQAMSARPRDSHSHSTHEAAQAAATSGDRRDLLHYLRLRRTGTHAQRA